MPQCGSEVVWEVCDQKGCRSGIASLEKGLLAVYWSPAVSTNQSPRAPSSPGPPRFRLMRRRCPAHQLHMPAVVIPTRHIVETQPLVIKANITDFGPTAQRQKQRGSQESLPVVEVVNTALKHLYLPSERSCACCDSRARSQGVKLSQLYGHGTRRRKQRGGVAYHDALCHRRITPHGPPKLINKATSNMHRKYCSGKSTIVPPLSRQC
jgi:hypothetical protein